jgi:hypothetical protein
MKLYKVLPAPLSQAKAESHALAFSQSQHASEEKLLLRISAVVFILSPDLHCHYPLRCFYT